MKFWQYSHHTSVLQVLYVNKLI